MKKWEVEIDEKGNEIAKEKEIEVVDAIAGNLQKVEIIPQTEKQVEKQVEKEDLEEVVHDYSSRKEFLATMEETAEILLSKISEIKKREARRFNSLLQKGVENQERELIETIVTDIELRKYSLAEAISTFPEYKILIEELYEQRSSNKRAGQDKE